MEIIHTKDTHMPSTIKIKHMKDLSSPSTISCLIYGQPGVGKTTVALSAPKPILLNLGGRIMATHQQDNIITINSYDMLLEVLKSGVLNNYDTIIIDTFDDLVTHLFDNLTKKDPVLKKDNGEPTMTGWGSIKWNMKDFLNELFKLDKHFIFTADVKEYKRGDSIVIRPGSKGKGCSINELINRIGFVGYMSIKDGKRTICFEPHDNFVAKNYLHLSEFIEIPEDCCCTLVTDLLDKMAARQERKNAINAEYDRLLAEQDDKLAHVQTVGDLNILLENLKHTKGKVIWDSDSIFLDKIKRLTKEQFDMEYDDASKSFRRG